MGSSHVCLIVGQIKSRVCWANLDDVAIRWHARTLTQLTLSQKSQGMGVGFSALHNFALPKTTHIPFSGCFLAALTGTGFLTSPGQGLSRLEGLWPCESPMTVDLTVWVQAALVGRPGTWNLVSTPMMIVLMPWVTLDEHSGQKCPEPSDLWLCEWVIHPGKQVAWPQLVKTMKQTAFLETYFHQLFENLGRQRKRDCMGLVCSPAKNHVEPGREERPARHMRQEFGVRC